MVNSKALIKSFLILTIAVFLTGYHSIAYASDKVIISKYISFVIPEKWEQKPMDLIFRLRRKTVVIRFLAVDEIKAIDGNSDTTVKKLLEVFSSSGRDIDSKKYISSRGHRILELTWHGKIKNGTLVKGVQHYIELKNVVIAVLYYAPYSEWIASKNEFKKIIGSMKY